ncbi:MAG: hypothetical protein KDD51_03210 [Bdellovibrionales bacterium]|nr:hypothetical protein [Bdellovibrionales bacterium]
MGVLLLLTAFFSVYGYGRCVPLPSGEAKFKLSQITMLTDSQCGVELEILDPLKQTWLNKGERADFWANDPTICGAKAGSVFTRLLIQECCDATYDWCTKKWQVGAATKQAKGKRISGPASTVK